MFGQIAADISGMSRNLISGLLLLLFSGVALTYASDKESGGELTAHQQTSCANCHTLLTSVAATSSVIQDNNSCLNCHNDKSSKSGSQQDPIKWTSLFHDDPARPCADCHSFHNPKQIRTNDGEFMVSDSEITAYVCQTCHLLGQPIELVSAGHRQAATELYHSDMRVSIGDAPSKSCLTCHSEHGFDLSDQSDKAIAISVAASHAFGVDVRTLSTSKRVRKIEDKIRLFNNKVECQSCHTLSSGTDDALVEYENQYDLCYGCHAIRG